MTEQRPGLVLLVACWDDRILKNSDSTSRMSETVVDVVRERLGHSRVVIQVCRQFCRLHRVDKPLNPLTHHYLCSKSDPAMTPRVANVEWFRHRRRGRRQCLNRFYRIEIESLNQAGFSTIHERKCAAHREKF